MALIDIKIPPGVYRNGTDLQSVGRWRDTNLVRWVDGTIRPIGGWRTRSDTAAAAKVRGMMAWADNSADQRIAVGTYNKLYAYNTLGAQSDITPVGLSAGREDAAASTGYGGGLYGQEYYGTPRLESTRIEPATSWAMQPWGEYLVACNRDDGKIYEWQLNASAVAAVLSNAPTNNQSIVVTEERFLLALGAGGNSRKVQWCDRENNTVWTPSATNEAGDLTLQTAGKIMAGVRAQGQTLILTSTDAHSATYLGPPYVFGIDQVGASCGLAAHLAYASVDAGVFWMGLNSFYAFTGNNVQELPCDVADYVFSDINRAQISKTFAMPHQGFGEIFWFYPSAASTENDRYVVYNYVENTWYIGELGRTAGYDMGTYRQPIWASAENNKLYEHEVGFNYDTLTPFAESGSIALGTGDNVMSVTEMIPDEKTQGDVTVTFKTKFYPNGTERSYGAFSMSNPTSLRFTGRQVKLRIEAANLTDWRVGINRLNVTSGGAR